MAPSDAAPPAPARPPASAPAPAPSHPIRARTLPPPPPEPVEEEPEVAQEEPINWAPAEPEPEPKPAESDWEEPRSRRRNPARLWTIAAVVAALLMVSALAAVYLFGPQQISAWMGSGEAGAERLRFTRRDVTREPLPTENELLTVTGEITNVTDEVQRLPQIRAEVTDAEQRVIFRWMIAPPVRELQPRQAVTFSSVSTDVPKGGRNLNLSFGPTT